MMSEQLFVVLMLAALVMAIALEDSPHPYRLAVAAGMLAGLAVLTRANGLILLAPLAFAAWARLAGGRPGAARGRHAR